MDDEIERDDEDFSFDHLVDAIGPQYAADHLEEIAQDYHHSGLIVAAVDGHRRVANAARVQIEKAQARLDAGEWDEAVFHAARALGGYLTEVFLAPFASLLLKPLRDVLPHVPIRETLLAPANGLESGSKFICIGIAATRDAAKAQALIIDLKKILKKRVDGGQWPIRNSTSHSLNDPTEAEARAFVAAVKDIFDRVCEPLQAEVEAADQRNAEAERKVGEAEAWRLG